MQDLERLADRNRLRRYRKSRVTTRKGAFSSTTGYSPNFPGYFALPSKTENIQKLTRNN